MLQEEAADWLLNHGFREEACALNPDLAINPYSTVPPKVEPEPEPEPVGPQRMDVASGRPVKNAMITLNIDNKEFVLFIFTRDELFFGRDGNRSDVVAIEPVQPHHLHAENIQKEHAHQFPSHEHLYREWSTDDSGCGRGNGTTLNGRKLAPETDSGCLTTPSLSSQMSCK